MKIQPNLFFKEALLFATTLALGLFVSVRYLFLLTEINTVSPTSLTVGDLVVFVMGLTLVWFISRVPKMAYWLFWIFISSLIFSGSQIAAASIVGFPVDVVSGVLVLLCFLTVRKVLVHDLAVVLAIAGLAGTIGIIIDPKIAIYGLVLFSFYDIVAVYKTKHMVQMAQSMVRTGAIFGFIIPKSFNLFLASTKEAKDRIGNDFTLLGSGDVALPLIFICSLVQESLGQAIVVAVFSLFGLLITHVLFINQAERKPMAALPPIAMMTLIGYLIALLII